VSAGLILLGVLSLAPGRPGRAAALPNLAGPSEGRAAVYATNALTVDFTFAPSPPSILEGGNIEFTDVSTTTEDAIVGRRWDFGDGVTLKTSDLVIEHTYNTPGIFTVTLTVTDSVGNRDTEVKPRLVRVFAVCKAITDVGFSFTPSSPRVGDVITLTAVVTPSNASTPLDYIWELGDVVTTTTNDPTVHHTYETHDTHTVVLTATNNCTRPGIVTEGPITVEPYRAYLPLLLKGG
jgi:PKD repeat protein